MENLNAETVKKALKCCDGTLAGCKECPNYNDRYRCKIEAEALALITSQEQRIKELTEENVRAAAKASDVVFIQVPSGDVTKWAKIILEEDAGIIDMRKVTDYKKFYVEID